LARFRPSASTPRTQVWQNANAYVEIWLEKDALSGVIYPVTAEYDVPLMVARGYASLSFLHSAAEYIDSLDVPTFIYHLGDYDPSGVNAGEKIEETLRELAPKADITFKRNTRANCGVATAYSTNQEERYALQRLRGH
jgi:hypothetical protein